ncbi:MAG: MFS transporter [Candidatus Geothermincolia bacterium]
MTQEERSGVYGYRWLVLVAYMLIAAMTQLMWLSYAPILKETEHLMGASEFKVVLLMTMFPLLYIPISIPAGIIIDRRGFRTAVLIGGFLTASFSFFRIFAGSYPLVLLGMVGIAVGQPFVLNSITKMVATWFPSDESATATGLAALSLFLGMILAFGLMPLLYKGFGGPALAALEDGTASLSLAPLRGIAITFSLVAAACFVFFALFARAKPAVSPRRAEDELLGASAAINWGSVRSIFQLYNFRILCIVIFVGNGCFVAIMQLLEKIMLPKGIGTTTAANIGTVMIVAGVVGCVVIPALSDKAGKRKPYLILAALATIPLLLLMAASSSTTLIFIISGLLGFFLFSALPVLLTFSEEITGAHLTGTAVSILWLLGNAGGVVLTVMMEGLKSAFGGVAGSFSSALIAAAAMFGVALIYGLRVKEGPGLTRLTVSGKDLDGGLEPPAAARPPSDSPLHIVNESGSMALQVVAAVPESVVAPATAYDTDDVTPFRKWVYAAAIFIREFKK